MTPQEFGATLLLLGFDYYHATSLHYTHRYGIGHPVMEISFTESWDEVCWSSLFPWAEQFRSDNRGFSEDNYALTTPGNLRLMLHLITTEQKEGADSAP